MSAYLAGIVRQTSSDTVCFQVISQNPIVLQIIYQDHDHNTEGRGGGGGDDQV